MCHFLEYVYYNLIIINKFNKWMSSSKECDNDNTHNNNNDNIDNNII